MFARNLSIYIKLTRTRSEMTRTPSETQQTLAVAHIHHAKANSSTELAKYKKNIQAIIEKGP